MHAVDAVIRARLYSEVALVRTVAEYIIQSGGKRLRPALVLLSANALAYSGAEQHIELAAVVEFIHTATLLHDDVVDESNLRRGQETANALFGNAASVLVGDFLYSRAFQMMVSCQNMRVMQILADATNIIAEGEVLQLLNIGKLDISEADYLQVIQYKTAKLFEAGTQIGAVISGADADTEIAFAQFGAELGTAFQIIDDVLDYSGEAQHIGKNIGDDLAEGKLTLPLIYTLSHGNEAQQNIVKNALKEQGREHFPAVMAAIQACGALEYSKQRAQDFATLAASRLSLLADSPAKQALLSLTEFALCRQN